MDALDLNRVDFSSRSLKDLLDARDAYHIHLMHKAHVVATAVGRYRLQDDDPNANHPPGDAGTTHPVHSKRRTLFNSVVRPWSWPCVLVFVDEWAAHSSFASEPDQMVPRALYLPDGRVVPTCVVAVDRDEAAGPAVTTLPIPRGSIGPGCAVLSTVQGTDRAGTIGALVTDGARTYALTNRHVAGEPGQVAYTTFRGQRERIGITSARSLETIAFRDAYPGWSGTDSFVNLDAGLIEVDDLAQWTPLSLGLGEMGTLVDLRPDSFTLDLIDVPVTGYGAASQQLDGTIAAFFYRYRAVGGREYVADFLIAPSGAVQTRPGDSGTVWHITPDALRSRTSNAPAPLPRPFALQWGGHAFFDSQTRTTARGFALASALSTIVRELDLDLVRSWDLQLPDYWGTVGHYTIASKAIAIIRNDDCFALLDNNVDNITYADADIRPGPLKGLSNKPFVPLADVPDLVWKMHGAGSRGPQNSPEHANHFADMDKPDPSEGNKTLLEITSDGSGGTDPAKVTPAVFETYYTSVADASRGCLPFRVWQLFDIMIATASAAEFVTAAGVLAHYVGDACQPLHISYMFDGIPHGTSVEGKGVHSAYETTMVGINAAAIIDALNRDFSIGSSGRGTKAKASTIKTGHDAATAVVQLMRETLAAIAPVDLVHAYERDPSPANLWQTFGTATVGVIEGGCRTLAQLYDAAWTTNPNELATAAVPQSRLKAFYLNTKWAPSMTLSQLGAALQM